jgi:hypothetical protein
MGESNQSPIDFGCAHQLLFFADHDGHRLRRGL